MAKYIPAEKLIAEIDSIWRYYLDRDEYDDGFNDALDKVKAFITSLQQEQPEVDYNKFEKLFDDFCERSKGHHITTHDACMWFWELGLNAKKEE